MKKILLIIGFLIVSFGAIGQLWDTYYPPTYVDSLNDGSVVQILVEDEDSLHVMYLSTLDSLYVQPADTTAGTKGQYQSDYQIAARLALKANTAAPTFTTSITIGSAGIDETELEILDGATLETVELNYVDGVTSAIQTQLDAKLTQADTVDGTQVLMLLSDTIPIFNIVVGAGNAGDTVLFSGQDVIWGAKWNGSFTLNITKVTGVVYGSSPDIDIALLNHANFRDGSATVMLSGSDLTITSTTTGDSATGFTDATVAPGEWLWIRVDECTAQPLQCIITIDGFLTE